jgi:polyhydroxyalkanoate synthesis regulator phasin
MKMIYNLFLIGVLSLTMLTGCVSTGHYRPQALKAVDDYKKGKISKAQCEAILDDLNKKEAVYYAQQQERNQRVANAINGASQNYQQAQYQQQAQRNANTQQFLQNQQVYSQQYQNAYNNAYIQKPQTYEVSKQNPYNPYNTTYKVKRVD